MRIAIILNCLRGGGAERIAGYLSKYLAQKHEVYLMLENLEGIVYEYGGQFIDIGSDDGEYIEYHVRTAKNHMILMYPSVLWSHLIILMSVPEERIQLFCQSALTKV